MTLRVNKKKWILYRHIKDFKLLCTVAEILKSYTKTGISKEDKVVLNEKLRKMKLYNERNENLPLDAISHKINQLSFYMFGYQSKVEKKPRFLFSPLGNLFLKHVSNEINIAKIFLTMLWAIQYPHPHSGTDNEFCIYPFRLIFKLLSDKRLSNKLYAFEVSYFVVFVKEINLKSYEELVHNILEFRLLSNSDLIDRFNEDSHAYVNAAYEWDYYVAPFLKTAGVLDVFEGDVITKIQHGSTKTYRKITKNEVTISKNIENLVKQLESEYSYSMKPLVLNNKNSLKIDIVKEIYSFYPKSLLESIGEIDNEIKLELLNLPKLIEQYSNNTDGEEAYLFEDALVDGFNLFYNIQANKIGGAGNTDIECLYTAENKKFAVDAKSTKNKLTSINSGRLQLHRNKIGGEYTIVVTPRYVPAVLHDIINSQIVIIRANTFSEYLYNCIDNDIREIDFKDFDEVIIKNMGADISQQISDLTINKFALTR